MEVLEDRYTFILHQEGGAFFANISPHDIIKSDLYFEIHILKLPAPDVNETYLFQVRDKLAMATTMKLSLLFGHVTEITALLTEESISKLGPSGSINLPFLLHSIILNSINLLYSFVDCNLAYDSANKSVFAFNNEFLQNYYNLKDLVKIDDFFCADTSSSLISKQKIFVIWIQLIKDRKDRKVKGNDLLQLLLDYKSESGESLKDFEIAWILHNSILERYLHLSNFALWTGIDLEKK